MAALRAALVGLGGWGGRHAQALVRLDGVRLVAVADSCEARVRAETDRSGATGYGDGPTLVGNEKLDVLFVCTPPMEHAQSVVTALDAGVHVFVEKPLARTLEDAELILDAVRRSGLVCAVGYQWRAIDFLPRLREALVDQEIALVVSNSFAPTRARPWFFDVAEGGGILLELATHDIDLQRAICGEVQSVQAASSRVPLAQTGNSERRIENAMTLILHFEGGGLGVANVAWTADGTPAVYTLDIEGSEASLHVDLDPLFRLAGTARGQALSAEVEVDPWQHNVARFLEAVRAEAPDTVCSTPHDAAQTLRAALACEVALESGATVGVPGTRDEH